MVRYVLRTVYNNVLDSIILLGNLQPTPLETQPNFVAFKYKIRHFGQIGHFWLYLMQFMVKAQTVPMCLVDSQTSL